MYKLDTLQSVQAASKHLKDLPTPLYLCEEAKLLHNLKILQDLQSATNTHILLALKGFAYPPLFDAIKARLKGVCASGLHEAMLGHEYGLKVHTYSPAYTKGDLEQIAAISHSVVFNSIAQLSTYAPLAKSINPALQIGLRINPALSFSPTAMYDPCSPISRFGVRIEDLRQAPSAIWSLIDGLHFHALCQKDSFALEQILQKVTHDFKPYLDEVRWINFGGGHHITMPSYDRAHLAKILKAFHDAHPHLQTYLEPGEAVGIHTGVLLARVLDVVKNGKNQIAILDASAENHMPDTMLMPYTPQVRFAQVATDAPPLHRYYLAGNTCLSGDVIGCYDFNTPLEVGDVLILEDMMHYSYVKNTTFNGVKRPYIGHIDTQGAFHLTARFGYEDYKTKLGG